MTTAQIKRLNNRDIDHKIGFGKWLAARISQKESVIVQLEKLMTEQERRRKWASTNVPTSVS